jgi:hypothetical protein
VLRHFWAPVHLTAVGPLAPDRVGRAPADLRDGPLGGLFLDANLVATLAAVGVNVLLAQVPGARRQGAVSALKLGPGLNIL